MTATAFEEWSVMAARVADDKLGSHTVVLDVGDVLSITDHFVITSGANARQVRAIAEAIEEELKGASGPAPIRVEGLEELEWVLLDYGPFVVHVFQEDTRAFFDLEWLWADCDRIEWAS